MSAKGQKQTYSEVSPYVRHVPQTEVEGGLAVMRHGLIGCHQTNMRVQMMTTVFKPCEDLDLAFCYDFFLDLAGN